ncbi:hypothetical protein SAMN02745119_03139 [Trichlorobacter thiogenes]|uniref:DUF4124 domain-containing protein n=1 Tax=Trichlorobacter thiogenes TaxID=115783 RepID=A0A1T4RXZ9_9BACT|nr:stage III sporulation AC/AD family protein [Trichlorobacter thiogenes]SKA20884.1 hypothetical protein SAMN02745119_03139 [Trichlorobacter thiogenes]
MRFLLVLAFLLFVAGMHSDLYATTYRYLDGNGNTCYADGLENVPAQYHSHVVVVVNGKRATPITKTKENVSGSVQEIKKTDFTFRFNWLVLLCLLAIGIFIAQRVRQSGRLEYGFRIQVFSVIIVLFLFIPLNFDLVRSATGALQAKKQQIQTEIKEQEERDKKPLKTLSEKVDEMMQQVQQ